MEIVGYEVDESGSPTSFSLWVVHNSGMDTLDNNFDMENEDNTNC